MRKDFDRPPHSAGSSLNQSKQIFIQNNSIQKPLNAGVYPQISFKGFDLSVVTKALKPALKPIPQKLTEKVFDSLKGISSSQYDVYSQIRKNYVEFLKLPTEPPKTDVEKLLRQLASEFRKKNGITDEIARNISESNLYYLPQKPVLTNFISQLFAPVTAVYKGVRTLFVAKNSPLALAQNQQAKILKDFSALEGLAKSHEIWENGYRKLSGHKKWTDNKNFLIPDDVLFSKIRRRRNKVVDPNKGKYSSTSLMLGNRLISGIIYSYFLGTDAYNTTMRYSNDKNEASLQRKSRIAQEFSRIGMNLYVQNLLFGTFESAVNRSLSSAMLVSGSTVAFSEVLGRKLVGKPIMPSDKATLDRLEDEMANKKGILPAIGRLLTNVKKKPANNVSTVNNVGVVGYENNKPNMKTFGSFGVRQDSLVDDSLYSNKNISFKGLPNLNILSKGFYNVEHLFDKNRLAEILKLIESADAKTSKNLKEAIMKSVAKSQVFEKKFAKKPETFDELMNLVELDKIPLGIDKTYWGAFVSSLFVPVKFVKNIFVSLYKSLQKTVNLISGHKNNTVVSQLEKLSQSNNPSDKAMLAQFKTFYNNRLKLEAWAKSALTDKEKEARLFEEFKNILGKDNEDIQGAKNILLWLDKQIKKANIKILEDGTFEPKDVEKIRKILKDSFLAADGSKHVEYDGNTISQVNINLSRAITTLFLMTDAYNLTMQYSNDNRKDANKSAKNRAAQEVSRITVSAYMLAFVHNLLSKLCNSSLAGAFTLTAITSSINDSLSREVVGVPLTAKSHDELLALDAKNAESQNPIKKALAYSIGKKNVAKAMMSSNNNQNVQTNMPDYFTNDFFIKPEIV